MIAFAITIHVVGVSTIATHLQTIGPWFLLLLAIEATATFCDAGGVYMMSRGPGAPPYSKVLVALFAGRAVNSVTPGGNVGEALKIALLARECSARRAIAAVMTVTLGGFVVAMSIVALGSLTTALVFDLPRAAEIALVICGSGCAAIATALAFLLKRGMLVSVATAARRLHLIPPARLERWRRDLANIDDRLRRPNPHRRYAFALIVTSQILQRGLVAVTIVATGYTLGFPQMIAVLTAGLVLAWVSNVVPMGVGISEGGNGVLFSMIGAPSSIGVALALAHRVNQIVFAAIGFTILAADRLAHPTLHAAVPPPELVTNP